VVRAPSRRPAVPGRQLQLKGGDASLTDGSHFSAKKGGKRPNLEWHSKKLLGGGANFEADLSKRASCVCWTEKRF